MAAGRRTLAGTRALLPEPNGRGPADDAGRRAHPELTAPPPAPIDDGALLRIRTAGRPASDRSVERLPPGRQHPGEPAPPPSGPDLPRPAGRARAGLRLEAAVRSSIPRAGHRPILRHRAIPHPVGGGRPGGRSGGGAGSGPAGARSTGSPGSPAWPPAHGPRCWPKPSAGPRPLWSALDWRARPPAPDIRWRGRPVELSRRRARCGSRAAASCGLAWPGTDRAAGHGARSDRILQPVALVSMCRGPPGRTVGRGARLSGPGRWAPLTLPTGTRPGPRLVAGFAGPRHGGHRPSTCWRPLSTGWSRHGRTRWWVRQACRRAARRR